MDDVISRLSEIRSQYNCFNESEEPYYRALSEAIKMLSEQADGDTISRQAALDALEWKWAGKAAIDAIKNLPTAEPDAATCWGCNCPKMPAAEKKGKWIRETGQYYQVLRCDQCGYVTVEQVRNYCPNCGARMEE